MQPFISKHREEIAQLCRKHHVRRLSIFGSAARDDFDPATSDVDIIVEFEDFPIEQYSDNKWALHDELAAKLDRKVDLLTWKSLSNPVIRKEIESTHVTLYAA
jgi:predicted nucleotidyltransferase